jgi:hypothetical protein
MKDTDRRAAVLEVIRTRTAVNTTSRKTAREALIAEEIYTHTGDLRAEYKPKPKRTGKAKIGAA